MDQITDTQKIRHSPWQVCVARTAFPSCAAVRGVAESLYYSWSKEFLEAGKRRLSGDTARQASSGEVKELRREMRDMKELVADLTAFVAPTRN